MLSAKELVEHIFFSSLATLAVLIGLAAAKFYSHAASPQIDKKFIAHSLLISFVVSLAAAIFIFVWQKNQLNVKYILALLLIYAPTIFYLIWSIKTYVYDVLSI